MCLIGLTGGIGMGKSTVSDYLQRCGETVIDTDVIARELVLPGAPAAQEVRKEFGESVFTPEGRLDRAALAALVFEHSEKRQRLEAILHPRIRQEWLSRVSECARRAVRRCFVVIPLLYETGAEREFQRVICVACSEKSQSARLSQRGWSDQQVKKRNAAQWPVGRKIDKADGVIWNEGTIELCFEQARRLVFCE